MSKPRTITAWQYTTGNEDYTIEKTIPVYLEGDHIGDTTAEVPVIMTSEGVREVKNGDYVVTDERDEVYVMSKEDFEYEYAFIGD
jgi:uncharacterized protein YjiK